MEEGIPLYHEELENVPAQVMLIAHIGLPTLSCISSQHPSICLNGIPWDLDILGMGEPSTQLKPLNIMLHKAR